MGTEPKATASANSEPPTIEDLRNYERERQSSSLAAHPQRHPGIGQSQTWSLPLESRVLQNGSRDDDIALNFLYVYPDILRKFPGPPCEALARTITYLQAIFTESPGFHPYVTHLPRSLPQNETAGRQVAETLERQLIRVLQNLFPFFRGDVNVVRRYINICPAELIPRPYFVVPSGVFQPLSPSNMLLKGIDGFNNHVDGGDRVWQSPVRETPFRRRMEQDALASNIQKCTEKIARKTLHPRVHAATPLARASTVASLRRPLVPQSMPMRPQLSNSSAISVPNPAPVQSQFQPQQFARHENPLPGSYPIVPPKPAQISISSQMQTLQQPYAGPIAIPARVSSPRPRTAATQTIPITADKATNTDDQNIERKLARLTAQMAQVLEIVEKAK